MNNIAETKTSFYQYLRHEFGVEVVCNLDTLTLFCNSLPRGIKRLELLTG